MNSIEMYEQTHLDNKLFLPPPVWDCMKSCKHLHDYPCDTFPLSNKERCQYGLHKNGTSGEDWFEVIRNHEVTHYCIYYEERKNKC